MLARHPLDVLVSILHFASHEPQTARWLDGEGGDESSILGAEPASAAFLASATGPRARALLAVTPEWWPHGGVAVRYEDAVGSPEAALEGEGDDQLAVDRAVEGLHRTPGPDLLGGGYVGARGRRWRSPSAKARTGRCGACSKP